MCNALSPGSPSICISLIHMYSSAPKDWFSFQDLPNMTHFSTWDILSKGLWMLFSDYEDKQENQWSVTADTSLTVSFCCASNTVSCLVFFFFLLDHKAEHLENMPRICFHSFIPHVVVVDGSAWMCVGERRWVQAWHVAWLPTVQNVSCQGCFN